MTFAAFVAAIVEIAVGYKLEVGRYVPSSLEDGTIVGKYVGMRVRAFAAFVLATFLETVVGMFVKVAWLVSLCVGIEVGTLVGIRVVAEHELLMTVNAVMANRMADFIVGVVFGVRRYYKL